VSQVDLVRRLAWVHPDQPKARKAIAVPLNAEAVSIIRGRIGKHVTHVFSFRGQAIRQVSTKAWYQALARCGIEDFRWHDLRHTWASWHVQNGTPLHALQELGGWESPQMARIASAAAQVCNWRLPAPHVMASLRARSRKSLVRLG
jgi:integrase